MKDSHLLGLVFGLIGIDILILVLWVILDPVELKTTFLDEQVD